jgi:hypothetical protein
LARIVKGDNRRIANGLEDVSTQRSDFDKEDGAWDYSKGVLGTGL